MSRDRLARCGWLLGVAWLGLGPGAAASTTFPEALRKKLELEEIVPPAPGCQLCHQDDEGGPRTATKPFGRAMLKAGTLGGSVPSMLAALQSVETDGSDSDRDGVGDVAELRAGTDPNVAQTVGSGGEGSGGEGSGPAPALFEEVPLPETGCALSGAATPSGATYAVATAFLAALLLLGRRRRS